MMSDLASHVETVTDHPEGVYVDATVHYDLPQGVRVVYEFGEHEGSFDLLEISISDENHKGEDDEAISEGFVIHKGSAHLVGEVAESVVTLYDDARDRALNDVDAEIEHIE